MQKKMEINGKSLLMVEETIVDINAYRICKEDGRDSGAGELLVTSMDRDGTQIGYDIDLMSKDII